MTCIPCNQKKLMAAQGQIIRPQAPWFPPLYIYIDEQDNRFEDPNLDLLLARITQFRAENKMPEIPYLKEVVVNFTMLSNDAYIPYYEFYTPNHQVHLSVSQYTKAASALIKGIMRTPEELFVSQEKAELRAARCLNCPFNSQMVNGRTKAHPGFGQSQFVKLAQQHNRTTTMDNALQLCSKCTCLLPAKVHFKLDIIKESSTETLLREFDKEYIGKNGRNMRCWIAQELREQNEE
jgi:hypothetical protein